MNAGIVGIDIGFASLRAVELSDGHSATPTLVRFCEEPLPRGAVSRGEVLEPNTVAAALKRLWSTGGFKSHQVVLGMGNHRVIARDLTVPKMSLKRIRESLPFQVQELISVPVAEALLDFYPIAEIAGEGDAGPQVTGLLVAAVKEAVLGNVMAVQVAGLTPVEVDLIPFALSRAIHQGAATTEVLVQIDVGAGTTSVVVTAAGVPQFVRLIPAGGDDVTQALATRLEIDLDQAEQVKHRVGLAAGHAVGASPADAAAAAIIKEVTTDLLTSLRNTVTYFGNTRPALPVARIVLTGGGARLGGFSNALGGLTRLAVAAPHPSGGVLLGRDVDHEALTASAGSFLVALGLALWSAE
ncbi:MAG: type IV pilus assembly protein PilM [Cryobacterium sp.]